MIGLIKSVLRLVLERRLSWRETHLLLIFLLMGFPVVVDLLNGFLMQIAGSNLSLGVLYRGALLAILLPFVLLARTFFVKIYIVALVGMWLIGNMVWMETGLDYSLVREVSVYSKVLYAWLVVAYLDYVMPKYRISIEYPMNCLVFFGTIAGLSIIFSYFTGYGIATYDRTSTFAVKSYFNAQNDTGLATLLSLSVCVYFFMRYGKWMYGIYSLIMCAGLVLLGTRAGMIGSFTVLGGATLIYVMGAAESRKRSGKRIFLVGFMFVVTCGGLYYALGEINASNYLQEKYAVLLEESPRETLEIAGGRRLAARRDLSTLLGEGSMSFNLGVYKYYPGKDKEGSESKSFDFGKPVEQDLYDMIGSYGILLGGTLLLVVLMLTLRTLISLIVKPSLLGFSFACAIGLFTVHSFTAGHAMGSAQVAAPVGLAYFYAVRFAHLPTIRRNLRTNLAGLNS